MSDAIYVPNLFDVYGVIGALQQAADRVLSPTTVRLLLERNRLDTQRHQHVHSRGSSPAVGCVNFVVGSDRTAMSFSIQLYTSGHHKGGALYVPPRVIQRMAVRIGGRTFPFEVSRTNNWFEAFAYAPSATFSANPQAKIVHL